MFFKTVEGKERDGTRRGQAPAPVGSRTADSLTKPC